MSDRSYLSVTIHSCPPEHRDAVAELLADADTIDSDEHAWEERCLGESSTYAHDLGDISPEIAYEIRQDARYEYDGDLTLHVPGMGTFTADLSASGQILITREQTLTAIREAAGDLPATLTAIDTLYGQPFTHALAALTAPRQTPTA